MENEFDKTKQEIERLVVRKKLLLDNLDITGGGHGLQVNEKSWREIKTIDRSIRILTRTLYYISTRTEGTSYTHSIK